MPGKDKSFEGPTKIPAVIKLISQEAKEKGIVLSEHQIELMLKQYFFLALRHMKAGDKVILDNLGTFAISPAEKKKLLKKDEYDQMKKIVLKRKRKRRQNHNARIIRDWKKHCAKLTARGVKSWTLVEYKKVFKKHKMRKIKKISDRSLR